MLMKAVVCLVAVVAVVAVVSAKEYYDAKFDKINVDQVIDNAKLVKHYGNCFLDQGPCPGISKELKFLIKDALKTACTRCSPKQTELIRKVIGTMSVREPQIFQQVINKFDPSGNLRQPFNRILGI